MGHGHHNIRYVGDPNEASGVWGIPNSLANFCEEDYAVTNYVAEFINTLTNVAYIYCAFRYTRKTTPNAPWHAKYDFMSFSLVVLGICSALFHGSMLQYPQFLDDLSMMLLAGALFQPVYAANRSPGARRLITLATVLAIGAVSAVYVRTADIALHSVSFVLVLTLTWPRVLYLVHYTGDRSEAERRECMRLFKGAFWCVVVGYSLWNVDLEFCFRLRDLKARLGMPFSWVLELHGWWHIFTAMSATYFARLIRILTDEEKTSSATAGKVHQS